MLLPTELDQLLSAEIPLETAIGPYLHALRTALKREACVQRQDQLRARPPTSGRSQRRHWRAGQRKVEAARHKLCVMLDRAPCDSLLTSGYQRPTWQCSLCATPF